MIPILLFIGLFVSMLLLIFYGLLDSSNKFYANIAALFIAGVIGIYLSAAISTV